MNEGVISLDGTRGGHDEPREALRFLETPVSSLSDTPVEDPTDITPWGTMEAVGNPTDYCGSGKIWSSEKGSMVDALELLYDEGRGKLRKAAGRSTHPEIRG